jgi:predicted RNA binding protein YcfA (HicA-like mRNA interferase family)
MNPERILRGVRNAAVRSRIRELLRDGWVVSLTGNNHVKLRHPNGRFVVTPLTSDKSRTLRDLNARVARVERDEHAFRQD